MSVGTQRSVPLDQAAGISQTEGILLGIYAFWKTGTEPEKGPCQEDRSLQRAPCQVPCEFSRKSSSSESTFSDLLRLGLLALPQSIVQVKVLEGTKYTMYKIHAVRIHKHMDVYVHTYTYTHTYIDTYIHTYIHTYVHTYVHTYRHTCIHTSHIHTYVCAYTQLHTCMFTYQQVNKQTYMHACMHAYVNTCICILYIYIYMYGHPYVVFYLCCYVRILFIYAC